MPVKDLREWIERIDAIGELTRVDGADPRTDIGGLTDLFQWDMGNPALLFDRIAGFPAGYRVLSNVLTSLKRVALSLDLPVDSTPTQLVTAWRDKLEHMRPRPVEPVESGPVLANQLHDTDVDVTKFPAPVWHSGDGGAYIGTGDIVIMRDPDSGWVNAGTYRVQVHDERTLGLYISSGKHGRLIRDKYWQRGRACPVAVSVGHDPLLLLLGGLEVDYGTNEYDVAGGVRNGPLEVVSGPHTGLPIPASAEIAFEGEIPPNELHEEGPFGEWAGYYASGRKPEPIINVQSVLYRDDPIVLGCIPGKPPNDNTFFRSPLRSALIWNELERAGVPGIVGVWSHEAGGGRLMNIVSIHQMYPGHAKQVGAATASCHAGAYANRWVIVVDDDIDPTDTNEVLWALCTRTDVIDDVDVLKRCWSTGLDPMAYGGQSGLYYNNRMIIDACRPFERLKTFPSLARADAQEAAGLRSRWSELFGADGKVRRDGLQVRLRADGLVTEPTPVRH
ncbi:MAG: UbiD family decarboxylase [Chloroflexi bacterium]|nr:UbiD family decarboxylase [Chloroflexota bacterium]